MADRSSIALTDPEKECLQKLKVSLATAIIRNKPSNLTGREFALKISKQLKRGEENWKQRAKKLEEELLQTKQDLINSKMKMKGSYQGTLGDEDILATDLDDVNVSLPSTSCHCPSLLTPPNSFDSSPTQNGQDAILDSSLNFLNSVTKLESLSFPGDFSIPGGYVRATLNQSVHVIFDHYKTWLELEHLPRSLALRGVLPIVKLLNLSYMDGHRKEVIQECQCLIKTVLETLMNCGKICRMELIESSFTLVTTLGKSTYIRKFALDCLLEKIQQVAQELKLTVFKQKMPNPAMCENSLCLFRMMESLLMECSECVVKMDRKAVKDLQNGLEGAALHLTDCFPLYTQYAWKLMSALELMGECTDNERPV